MNESGRYEATITMLRKNSTEQRDPAVGLCMRVAADDLGALEAEREALRGALEAVLRDGIFLTAEYLNTFRLYPDDHTVQGWDVGRWRRARASVDAATALLASPP